MHVSDICPQRIPHIDLFINQLRVALKTLNLYIITSLTLFYRGLNILIETFCQVLNDIPGIFRGVSGFDIEKSVQDSLCTTEPFSVICAESLNDYL
jgi:hypothetical protein